MLMLRSIGIRSAGSALKASLFRPLSANSITTKFDINEFNPIRRFNSTKAAAPDVSGKELELSRSMTWEQFLDLRKQQRRISLISSGFGSLIAVFATWSYVENVQIDPTETIYGFDALTISVAGMMAMSCVGFVLGPSLLGDPIFSILHRSQMKAFTAKQKIFLKHIIKMRVDASRQSMNNPVPDYYGEKIGSLNDYRQWLRDCNEYRRKANQFL